MIKKAIFKTKGMQRDLSASSFSSDFSYENMNMRIYPSDDSTLLSLINEKGTRQLEYSGDTIEGTVIGQAVIEDFLILFTTGNGTDRIYRIKCGESCISTKLYEGHLEFDYHHPIETLPNYENEDLIKIYWTDGKSQPRVINITASESIISKWEDSSFDFVQKLDLNEEVFIRKSNASGNFPTGTIQYAFTYINLYGQESNIFYVSPLYYTSFENRGGSPEESVNNSFEIEISNIDPTFDYVRIYSILRTSINAVPEVRRVADVSPIPQSDYTLESYTGNGDADSIFLLLSNGEQDKALSQYSPVSSGNTTTWQFNGNTYSGIIFGDNKILWDNDVNATVITYNNGTFEVFSDNNTLHCTLAIPKIIYVDTGLSGDTIDPTELLYVGGEEVVFGTMSQKDNTLFLGDIKIKRKNIDTNIREFFKGKTIISSTKELQSPSPNGYYPYDNQLKYSSYQIKTFKYLEYYRLGVQFQHYTGVWSEPIWINDIRNETHISTEFYNDTPINLPIFQYTLNDQDIITQLTKAGYIKIRAVIVYPSLNDRECICQGILCPTVYNVADRFSNSPFAQSSWFTRPNAPFDLNNSIGNWIPLGEASAPSKDNEDLLMYSRAAILGQDNCKIPSTDYSEIELTDKGAWAEFRHNYPIPGSDNRNAEIQCIWRPPKTPYVSGEMSESDLAKWLSENSEYYFVDQSVLTFHSPDIEFGTEIQNMDSSDLKLRIVGMVPITSFDTNIDIHTSTPVISKGDFMPIGFYHEHIGVENDFTSEEGAVIDYGLSHHGWKGMISGAFWFDLANLKNTSDPNNMSVGYAIYPWHRSGSLNNTKFSKDGYKAALLDIKRMLNYRYSYKTVYLDNDELWYPPNQISGVAIFNSNEVSVVRIPAPANSGLPDINYYGNIDKVIVSSRTGNYNTTEEDSATYKKSDGYPIIVSGVMNTDSSEGAHELYTGSYKLISKSGVKDATSDYTGVDPVRMRYKSSPHAVLALNNDRSNNQIVLPTIYDGAAAINNITTGLVPGVTQYYAFWDKEKKTLRASQSDIRSIQGPIGSVDTLQYGWLWLGELYRESVTNRFGGQTEEAFESNQWLPCGDPISLIDNLAVPKNTVTITWEEGDTYYQRYDHIKTYPFSTEDPNQVTDIISFMCETRYNIDGRYDKNRGQINNMAITQENFNIMNPVYSQDNNFFNYRGLNHDRLNLYNFPNTITWTKTKTEGEITDSWTNITLSSVLNLDGDLGTVRALRRFNNNLVAFQDKGISHILYNESMQISTTEGVPVEIANSNKVNGKRYITNNVGCTNKWSICNTPNGIYFIDDITKGIFLFNGQLTNLSDRLGFHSWINKVSEGTDIWNPVDFNGFVTYYDKVNGDVFFINKEQCLAFSEPLGQFSSFYNYEKVPYFSNVKDIGVWVKGNDLWLHNKGDYNMFFGSYKPFYTTVIANPDMTEDKIFNNIEFRSDTWDKNNNLLNSTFDTLEVWNEYQHGSENLTYIKDIPSSLKRKFRIWRANIPRDNKNGMDRMRNPWLYLRLSKQEDNTDKTILHDIVVNYFE